MSSCNKHCKSSPRISVIKIWIGFWVHVCALTTVIPFSQEQEMSGMPKPVLNLAKGQLPILGRPDLSLIPPSFCSQMHICTGTPHSMGLQQCCLPLILEETSSRVIEFLQAAPWSSKLIDSVFEWGYTVESLSWFVWSLVQVVTVSVVGGSGLVKISEQLGKSGI